MKYFLTIFSFLVYSNSIFAQTKQATEQDSIPTVQLSEVTVNTTAKNQNQQLKDYYIANKNATTEDILARLPEITLIKRGSYGIEPLIRSYGTGQVNLLIDGMRIHGACTDKMDPVSIYVEPQNLESIQVSTRHATQAGSTVGGTIDMKLKAPECSCESLWTGSLSSGYQTAANAFFESAVLQYSKDKWAVRANITYRKASDYRSGKGKIIPYSAYEKLNYGLSVKYNINQKLSLKTDVLFDDGWNIGYPALPMDVGYAAARIVSLSLLKENENGRFKNSELKMYANRIYHLMDDTHRKDVYMHMDMPGLSKTFGAYANTQYFIGKKQNLQLRADISSTELWASMTMYQTGQTPMYMLTWPNNRSIQAGVAATYKNKLDSLNTLVISTRMDQFINSLITDEAKNHIAVLQKPTSNIKRLLKNLSAEFTHQFGKHFKTSATLAYAERMPTATELYGFYLFNAFDNYDYLGNTTLQNEQALKADVNLSYTKSKWQISFNAYAAKIDNYILGMYQSNYSAMTYGAYGVKQFSNIKYAMLSGADVGIIYKPQTTLQIISTFKYNYGADNTNNAMPLIAPFKNITSVRKQFKHMSVQVETEAATTQNRVNVLAKEAVTKGFVIANIRVAYTGNLKANAYRIDAGIENILDQAYTEHLDWNKINRAGRNFYLGLSYTF